jgi:hypothetical protein
VHGAFSVSAGGGSVTPHHADVSGRRRNPVARKRSGRSCSRGINVADPRLLARFDRRLTSYERAVEVPRLLFALAALGTADCGDVVDSGRGTYLVRGSATTDTRALATIRERGLPDHETVVEIAGAVLASTERA